MNMSEKTPGGAFARSGHIFCISNQLLTPLVQVAARTFVQKKEYGLALSYCSSAEDWPGLGRVVDRILQEYIHTGSVLVF